ncbi:hypothetical protein [Streptomyces sviceus]|uniref:hypothetical protein n=1 Tax=Streptomyces sviceus TaxID=285530 RepID=UPI0036E1ADD6
MTPNKRKSRLLRAIRWTVIEIWRSTLDGITTMGAFYGALPPAHLAALLSNGMRSHRPETPAPSATEVRVYGPSDILLTPAERQAWNQLVERL